MEYSYTYLNAVFGSKKKKVTYKQSSDSLCDFAEGKTPTNSVTLVEKCYSSLPIILYNKACILVKMERRREA